MLRTFVHSEHSIFTALLLFLSFHFIPSVLSVCSLHAERGGDRLEEECGSHVWDGRQEETFQCWTVSQQQQQPVVLLQYLMLQKTIGLTRNISFKNTVWISPEVFCVYVCLFCWVIVEYSKRHLYVLLI